MIQLTEEKREQLTELCRKYRVYRLDLVGSAARGKFNPESSDLDFIARFEGTRESGYAERFYYFAESLQALFGRPVDVLTENMIQNPYFREDVEAARQRVLEIEHEPRSTQAAV